MGIILTGKASKIMLTAKVLMKRIVAKFW